MAPVVEQDEARDLLYVGLFGAIGMVLESDGVRTWSRSFLGAGCMG
jgi:hypothetical protein